MKMQLENEGFISNEVKNEIEVNFWKFLLIFYFYLNFEIQIDWFSIKILKFWFFLAVDLIYYYIIELFNILIWLKLLY